MNTGPLRTLLLLAGISFATCSPLLAQGQWTAAASMPYPRHTQSATLLLDGRVLVAGGADDFWGESVQLTCAIYNPYTDRWQRVPDMPTARSGHTAALMLDGRVMFIGGYNGNGMATTACDVYNPWANSWSTIAPMHIPRETHAAVVLNRYQLMVIGGRMGNRDLQIWAPTATCEIYDTRTNKWTMAARMNLPRTAFGVAKLPDGRVLVTGGTSDTSAASNWAQPANPTCEIYDPVTNSWSYAAPYPSKRNSVVLESLCDNRIISIGGEVDRQSLSDCMFYDAAHDRWEPAAAMAAPRLLAQFVHMPSGDIVATGGWQHLWDTRTNDVECYHTGSNDWHTLPPMIYERGAHTATLMYTGEILVTGGMSTGGTPTSTCERFRPRGCVPGSFGISAVCDVAEDDGGHVRVYWASHADDVAGANDRIISYSILLEDQVAGAKITGVQGRWTVADTVPADGSGLYSHVVPTVATGSAAAPVSSRFLVMANSGNGSHYTTAAATGEAYDNVGPDAAGGVAVDRNSNGNRITWAPSTSGDVREYAVYRGDRPDVPIAPAALLGTTPSTTYTDFEGEPSAFYRIVAIDSLGNSGPGSAPAEAVASAATADAAVEFLTVGANYPQPCSVWTTIPLTLGHEALVSVEVQDQLGVVAASLDQQWMPAGENRIHLSTTRLPSGTYHCIVRAGEASRSIMLRVVR
ncbi:MAG TPA: kelch repeat-containing protein [Candidatus Kapabacteria bacterium]|nr:kelch repeat-containing protein [Candidatus Kapabacteria bacterium]